MVYVAVIVDAVFYIVGGVTVIVYVVAQAEIGEEAVL